MRHDGRGTQGSPAFPKLRDRRLQPAGQRKKAKWPIPGKATAAGAALGATASTHTRQAAVGTRGRHARALVRADRPRAQASGLFLHQKLKDGRIAAHRRARRGAARRGVQTRCGRCNLGAPRHRHRARARPAPPYAHLPSATSPRIFCQSTLYPPECVRAYVAARPWRRGRRGLYGIYIGAGVGCGAPPPPVDTHLARRAGRTLCGRSEEK